MNTGALIKNAANTLRNAFIRFFIPSWQDLASFWLLEKIAVLRIRRQVVKNMLGIWSDSQKSLLVRIFLLGVQIEIELFRVSLFFFLHLYYILYFSTLGCFTSICMLPVIFGLIDQGDGAFLFCFYFIVLVDSLFIYLLCRFNPRFEQWMYSNYARRLVTILCGNHPMRHTPRLLAGVLLYGVARQVDGAIADGRVYINRELFLQTQKDHGLPVDEEALWKAHRMAEQRFGHGSLRQLEGATAAGIGEFLKVWSQKKD